MKPEFRPNETIAVVVGVERYATGERWDLSGPSLDAVAFVEWLRARGVPADNIYLFLSTLPRNEADVAAHLARRDVNVQARAHATTSILRPMLQKTLKELAAGTKLLYLFWGGHGAMESDQERRLFCDDTAAGDFNPVNLPSLLETLRSKPWSSIREQLVIVDACANYYEAMKYRQGQAEVLFSKGNVDLTGVDQLVLLAAASGEKAGNDPVQRSGDFSRHFLDLIGKSAIAEWPDFGKVARDLERGFQARTAEAGARQHPVAMRWRRGDGASGAAGVYPVSGEVQDAAGEADIGIPQLRTLVSFALAESSLADAARRDALVAGFPPELRDRIKRHPDEAEADLLQIFAFALGQEHRVTALRRAIEKTEVDAGARDGLLLSIDRIRLAVAVRARISDATLTVPQLRALYKRSAPDAQLAPEANTLDEMIEHLQEMTAREEGAVPPVVEFVERVAQALSSAELAQWVTTWSARTTGGAQPAVGLRERIATERSAAQQGRATLYVDISEVHTPTTSLGRHLRYWVYDASQRLLGGDTVASPPGKDEKPEAAARRAMADVLQRASALMERADETSLLTIELFVTLEQLMWDFDEWKLYVGDAESPSFGISYPMALRWVERGRSHGSTLQAERRNAWRRAARRIREHAAAGDPPKAFWLARDGSKPPVVEATLKAEHYGSYVALQFVPAFDHASALERKLVRAVLYGGAPFAIWRRSAPDAWPALQNTLDDFLGASPFDELPKRCVELRLSAVDDTTAPGHSLAILWDDPDRNPLDLLLSHLPQRTP